MPEVLNLRYHEVKEAHLAKIVKVDLKSDLFSYAIDEAALKQAELMDGKLMLVTNVADLTPPEVVQRYKALADIERGFRVLKSEIEIAPVYHRLPERICAHALVCFLALIVYRVMRQRLKLAKSDLSPRSSTVRRVSTLISLTFGLKRAPTTGSSAGFDLAV